MPKIMISAGEISGDVHGAKLVAELKKLHPDISFFGMGHTRLKNEGVKIIADLADVSTIGFFEPIRYLPKILRTFMHVKEILLKEKPDALITIDYQGFHLPLCAFAKKHHIPVIYYIAPQEWQWGSEAGGRKVVRATDLILSIFQEEALFYNKLGGNAFYIGHPILDLAQSYKSKETFYHENNIDISKKILAIFPGSRPQELTYTYPVLLQAAQVLCHKYPQFQVVISVASDKFGKRIMDMAQPYALNQPIFYKQNQYDLIAHTYLSLVTSGTVTLEHACFGTPCIANYRFNAFFYGFIKIIFAKQFKRIPFIALPNLLLHKMALPEFRQADCTATNIILAAENLITDEQKYLNLKKEILKVRDIMSSPGVIFRAAQQIISFLRLH